MPNMYARGILFGKMVLELGDICIAKNEKNNLFCDLDFKTKVSTSYLLHACMRSIHARDLRGSSLVHTTPSLVEYAKVPPTSVKYREDGVISWTSRVPR